MSALTVPCVLLIPSDAVDDEKARGGLPSAVTPRKYTHRSR